MKIAVVGTGYVGLSLAVLLSQRHHVYALDIDARKVELLKQKKSPSVDGAICSYLKTKTIFENR